VADPDESAHAEIPVPLSSARVGELYFKSGVSHLLNLTVAPFRFYNAYQPRCRWNHHNREVRDQATDDFGRSRATTRQ